MSPFASRHTTPSGAQSHQGVGVGSRSGIIEVLTADHRRIQRLVDRIRCSAPGGSGRRALVEQLGTSLVRHFAVEREYLCPALRRYLPDGGTRADGRLAEYREIEELLTLLEAREPDDERFGDLLVSVVTRVTEHVVVEEQLLFPRLQGVCPADVLQELESQACGAEPSAPVGRTAAPVGGTWGRLRDAVSRRGRQ